MCRFRHIPSVFTARLAHFFTGREIVPGFERMCRFRHMSPVFTARLARFFNFAKKSRRVTLADSFFTGREIASGFEKMCRLRHMSPVSTARSARFFMGREIASGFEGTRRLLHMSSVFAWRAFLFKALLPVCLRASRSFFLKNMRSFRMRRPPCGGDFAGLAPFCAFCSEPYFCLPSKKFCLLQIMPRLRYNKTQ